MKNTSDDVALTEVIGFIMLLALVVTAFSLYTVYVVPVIGREDEIAQLNYVEEQFTDYKLMVDTLWISRLINVNGANNPMYPVLNVTPAISSTTMRLGTGGTTQPGGFSLSLFKPVASTGLLSIKTTGDTFDIDSNSSHAYKTALVDFPINVTALEYSSDNYYWIQQRYTYQLGGVFLSQDDGTVNRISPLISITRTGATSFAVSVVPVQVFGAGSYSTISSNNPVRVDTRQRIRSNYNISRYPNNQWVNISITTADNATAAMWLNLFKGIVVSEQIPSNETSLSGYKIRSAWNPGSKRATVFIYIAGPTSQSVALYVQRAEFDVTFNMVASEIT